MSQDIDVTHLVDFDNPDDEFLPLTKCVCGEKFETWAIMLSIYRDQLLFECAKCKRRLYFRQSITVYEVRDEQN